jgi:hypothetical protein
MNKVKIGEKEYCSIDLFMIMHNLKTRKSVYDWLKEGKVEKKKIGTNSFFLKV